MAKKKWQEKHNLKSGSYELPADMKDNIDDVAGEIGVPKSQLVAALLLVGFDALESGDLDLAEYLSQSRSPLYRYVIDLEKLKNDWKKHKK